jgi:HK97 family phage portal protein
VGIVDVILGRPSTPVEGPRPVATAAVQSLRVSDAIRQAQLLGATRSEAMSVPAIARARNLIAGTIAGMPLLAYVDDEVAGTNVEVPRLPWMRQPEVDTPRATTLAYTVDSLLFYGRGYWRVTDVYREDGRPRTFEWIDPTLVTFDINIETGKITRYYVNLTPVPASGIGSLVVFSSLDEGILIRGGQTIKAAYELEAATVNYARNPAPSITLKNTGMDLPSEQVEKLLSRWRESRRSSGGSVAYLSAALDMSSVGFSPKDMMLVEAREYQVAEIARLTGIPPWYLGADTGGSMTYSNVNSTRRDLLDFSLHPYVSAIEQRLSMDDVTPRGTHVSFSFTDFLRSSPIERAQLYNALVPLGILSPEEARQLEDTAPGGPRA